MKIILSLFILFQTFNLSASTDSLLTDEQKKVFALVDKVESENKYIEQLQEGNLHDLPIGIIKEIGETRYVIAIDSAVFKPTGAYFHAYMAIDCPGNGDKRKRIAFAAKNIKFNPSGVIGSEQSRLVLVSNHSINVTPRLKLNLNADGHNYVEWNCEGFQAVNLRGEFEISGDRLVPIINGQREPDQTVKANFEIHTNDIHNFVTSVSVTPFGIQGLNEWDFEVTNAVVDMSELNNFPQMQFPVGYQLPVPSYPQLWKGFYLKQLKIKLPSELGSADTRTEILAQNLLIDDSGFTGKIQVNNVLTLDNGNMSGWGFSIDKLAVSFLSNNLSAGEIEGKIKIPAMKNNGIGYGALISFNPLNHETNYSFTVSPANDLSFDAFSAKVDLNSSSYIQINKLNGQFIPKAVLSGKIYFLHENVSSKKLEFQNLTFVTTAPYLTNGVFALTGEEDENNKVAKFDFSISNLRLLISPDKPKIGFDATVNFMNAEDHSFSGTTTVLFEAKIGVENGLQAWSLNNVSIGKITLDVNTCSFYLNGDITFRDDDPIFGDGFDGSIRFQLYNVMENTAEVNVQFGKTDFRYFYVDAFIPVSFNLGNVKITRLMGGLYYHMRPAYNTSGQFYAGINNSPQPQAHRTKYLPDGSIGMGFKTGVSYEYLPSERVLNGDAMFEVAFNSSGGLNFIRFDGKAYMLCTKQERMNKPAPAYASVLIQYDHQQKIFDATLSAYVNASGINGSATSKIHFEPSVWFVCVGRPTAPGTISIAGLASASAYVLAGNQLEPMAPPPSIVASLVSSNGLNNLRDANALSNASGFAAGIRFGSSFYKSTEGDLFRIYGGFSYGLGFDMMLVNHGSNAHCSNSSATVGLNGWVAQGQLYAYLQGSVGIAGTFAGQDFALDILSGTVAAILGGKLPNPAYAAGAVACQYSILGGLLKGSFSFDFEIGNNCSIVNG